MRLIDADVSAQGQVSKECVVIVRVAYTGKPHPLHQRQIQLLLPYLLGQGVGYLSVLSVQLHYSSLHLCTTPFTDEKASLG